MNELLGKRTMSSAASSNDQPAHHERTMSQDTLPGHGVIAQAEQESRPILVSDEKPIIHCKRSFLTRTAESGCLGVAPLAYLVAPIAGTWRPLLRDQRPQGSWGRPSEVWQGPSMKGRTERQAIMAMRGLDLKTSRASLVVVERGKRADARETERGPGWPAGLWGGEASLWTRLGRVELLRCEMPTDDSGAGHTRRREARWRTTAMREAFPGRPNDRTPGNSGDWRQTGGPGVAMTTGASSPGKASA